MVPSETSRLVEIAAGCAARATSVPNTVSVAASAAAHTRGHVGTPPPTAGAAHACVSESAANPANSPIACPTITFQARALRRFGASINSNAVGPRLANNKG